MSEFIHEYIGLSPDAQFKILYSIISIIIFWVLHRLTIKLIVNKIESFDTRYIWSKYIRYIAGFINILILISIWLGGLKSIGTYLGLLSAGLAIAMKDLLVNLTGWIFIITRKPFIVGDRIEIDNIIGDVIDIRLFQFSVVEIGNWVDADQSTGRIIHIPNGHVFIHDQANYTLGFEYIWNEIPVLLTFESDWKKAKVILNEVVNKHIKITDRVEKQIKETASRYMIKYNVLTPAVYTTVKDSGVLLTIRYICHARERRMTDQTIWEDILEEFAKFDNIDFAYPTQRFYNNAVEGKEGTKPENKL
jgi:small-conductance mechanosensitive channel